MANISWPWAIVLCRFLDIPEVPQNRDYYEDLYTRNGTGGLCDYWRAVSCNALDLTGSRVFGWFTMNHPSAELSQLRFPGDRSTLVRWGLDAAVTNGVSVAAFRSVLIVQNFGVDHGAASNGILIVHQNATLCEFGFIAHEMGHGFGLPHSFAANPDREYGDGWDVMSFATTTFQFPIQFRGTQGDATVGLNARNLEALNAVPVGRAWIPAGADFSERITLDALNQLPMGNHGPLMVKIPANATQPPRANDSSYTVEFRRKAGWDRGIPEDAVLIHEVRTNRLSYLQPGIWGRFTNGQEFVTPDPKVFIRVASIDSTTGTATLRIWDIPEGSLRKEDSKPKVFLIQDSMKRWVTSPQALLAIGKDWAYVRVVPDGGLIGVPDGPDLSLQANWRWCRKCQGLFFGGNPGSQCPVGGAHDSTGSGDYHLAGGIVAAPGQQPNWRWCRKCQGLFFGGNPGSRCPTGGTHDSAGSGNYVLLQKPAPSHQTNWRWCRKCQGLFFGGNPGSVCPASNEHDPTGSGNYSLLGV